MNTGPISHVVTVTHPTEAALARGPAAAMEMANAFEIVDAETFALAADELKAVKSRLEKLDEQRRAITKPLDSAKAAVMALFRGPTEALEAAEKMLKGKLLDYQREEQRRADEDRILREREAQAEREKLLAEANTLEESGKEGEAFAVRMVAYEVVSGPTQTAPVPKVAGISTSETYTFEVVDMTALVQYIATRPELICLMAVDSINMRSYVRSLGSACTLPGVHVSKKRSIRSRK